MATPTGEKKQLQMKAVLCPKVGVRQQESDPRLKRKLSLNDNTVTVAVKSLIGFKLGRPREQNQANTIAVCRVDDPHL